MRTLLTVLVASAVLATSAATWAAPGGPAGFGYTWADSDEPGVTYAYEAIYGNYASLSDEDFVEIPLGFDFPFYGGVFDTITVTSNGVAHFDGADVVGYNNVDLPFDTYRMMAIFWDDLNPGNSGSIWWDTQGSSPNSVFLVEWFSVPHFYSSGTGTFEIKLYEADGAVEFHYEDTNFGNGSYNQGASATCGIQDGAMGHALQRSRDQSVLGNNYAVRLERGSCTDDDGDGYESSDCGGNDCDDGNAHVNPGAAEDCNGIDDNCNGTVDEGCGDDDDDTSGPGDDDDTSGPGDDDDTSGSGDDDDTGGGPWDDDDDDDTSPGNQGPGPGGPDTTMNSNPTFGIQCACRTAPQDSLPGVALVWLLGMAAACRFARSRP